MEVSSFDGGVTAHAAVLRPDRYRFWDQRGNQERIPRGAGLSYAAASFREGGVSVEHTAFDRVLDFDERTRTVEVESGISLDALHEFLSARGLYLKIQPGYGRITVGGCIATDAHGKNQARDGTFINQVAGLTLFHPSHGLLELDEAKAPELFRLTCGGFGLTGHIIKARLRASPLPADAVKIAIEPVEDVSSASRRMADLAAEADFVYTWHDFTAQGAAFGKGFVCVGRFAPGGRDAAGYSRPALSLSAANRAAWRLPLLNRLTTRALNAAYLRKQLWAGGPSHASLRDAQFPVHTKQLYFKLFGAPGFHEFQAIVPLDKVAGYGEAIREYLARRPVAITLASGKLFRGERELLRFTGDGLCLALNFPRTAGSDEFLKFLDDLVVSVRGLPNIIKDSRIPATLVNATYPGAQRFRDLLRAFDPQRLFRSELSGRLQL